MNPPSDVSLGWAHPKPSSNNQPMSLLTVSGGGFRTSTPSRQAAGDVNEDDLLTLRILEASERKMMLIRELLSPEEYKSLSLDLFATPIEFNRGRGDTTAKTFTRSKSSDVDRRWLNDDIEAASKSGPPFDHPDGSSQMALVRRSSISGLDASKQAPSRAHLGVDAKENVEKRRKAIEFFFGGQNRKSTVDVMSESRFGHYLAPDLEGEDRLLSARGLPSSVLAFLFGILVAIFAHFRGSFGRLHDPKSASDVEVQNKDEELEGKFMNRYKTLSCAPYNRRSNMLIVIERLRAEDRLGRLAELKQPSQRGKPQKDKPPEREVLSIIGTNYNAKLKLVGLRLNWWIATRRLAPVAMTQDCAVASRLLVHQPEVELMANIVGRTFELLRVGGRETSSLQGAPSRPGGWPSIEVRLEKFSIVQHKLLEGEVRLAKKLVEIHEQHALIAHLIDHVCAKTDQLSSDLREMLDRSEALRTLTRDLAKLFDSLVSLLELECNLLARLSMKQLRLSVVWDELEAVRASQGYRLTPQKLSLVRQSEDEPPKIAGILEMASNKFALEERRTCARGLEKLQKLARIEKAREKEVLQRYTLERTEKTPAHELPRDVLDRKQDLTEWLESLRVAVRPTDKKSGRSSLEALFKADSVDDLYDSGEFVGGEAGTEASHCLVQAGASLPGELKLDIALSCRPGRFASLMSDGRSKSAIVAVPVARDIEILTGNGSIRRKRYRVQLELPQASNEEGEPASRVSVEFSISCSLADSQSSRRELARRLLIERLYASVFATGRNPCESVHTKLAKLLNRIDRSTLNALLRQMNITARASEEPYCVVSASHVDFSPRPAGMGSACLRVELLARRWLSQALSGDKLDEQPGRATKSVIYLTERENLQRIEALSFDSSRQIREFKEQMAGKSVKHPKAGSVGYKSVEWSRSLALDFIQRLELLIDQMLESHFSESSRDAAAQSAKTQIGLGQRARVSPSDLLIEAKLNLKRPELSLDIASLVRLLLPRPTARRPLMPKRRQTNRLVGGRASKFGQLVGQARLATDKNVGGGVEAVGQWWRSGRRQSGENLRLIVTIQKATNVPYRSVVSTQMLMRQQQQQLFLGSPMPLSNSPFSPSPMFSGTTSPLGVMLPVQQRVLVPATTYVEAVFQRRQLASSLAQGKSPSWNETLFFSVDLNSAEGAVSSDNKPRPGRLADEYLQLNLYDCRSFTQDQNGFSETVDSQWPSQDAAPGGAIFNDPLLASGGPSANRLLVAQRRIERHLIGSVRIPLSVLLATGGRVEGSFALNQPLLLDNYHYEPEWAQFQAAGKAQLEGGDATTVEGDNLCAGSRTHLSLFITLDPPVSLPLDVGLPTGSHERADLFEFAKLWERVMVRFSAPMSRARGRTRLATSLGQDISRRALGRSINAGQLHVRALVLRDDALYCVACRHLRPMTLPPELIRKSQDDEPEMSRRDDLMRRLARFVSLLSPLKDGLFHMRALASVLWFDSHQLLANHLGGQEEKAVLLCNYFLQMGKCSALLFGESLQSGRCVYVIVWSEQLKTGGQLEAQMDELMEVLARRPADGGAQTAEMRPVDHTDFIARLPILINSRSCHLWDPNLGLRHELTSLGADVNRPPLLSVGSIVTLENVYANVQPATVVGRLSFDIRQKSLWFPLFNVQAVSPNTNPEPKQVESNCAVIRRDARRLAQMSWRRKLAHLELLGKLVGRPVIDCLNVDPSSVDAQIYAAFDSGKCLELKEALERSIKSHLLTWRPTRPTYFNRTLSLIIADKLASFERQILQRETREQPAQRASDDHPSERQEELLRRRMASQSDWWRQELAELIRSETSSQDGLGGHQPERRVISWPVNLTYTNMQTIIDGLFASGVHNSDLVLGQAPAGEPHSSGGGTSTQFLVAVHVEPYPARVMSVWLYVGALVTANHLQANKLQA